MWQHTYQHTTDASAEQLWTAITDIEHWSFWNSEIESTKLDGPLTLGFSFTLKPKGGPKVKLAVEEFSRPTRFTDLAHLPLGKMRTIHEFLPTATGAQITITLQIYGLLGLLWRKVIGEKQAQGLVDQTAHFIDNAKSR